MPKQSRVQNVHLVPKQASSTDNAEKIHAHDEDLDAPANFEAKDKPRDEGSEAKKRKYTDTVKESTNAIAVEAGKSESNKPALQKQEVLGVRSLKVGYQTFLFRYTSKKNIRANLTLRMRKVWL